MVGRVVLTMGYALQWSRDREGKLSDMVGRAILTMGYRVTAEKVVDSLLA